jgi:hypothetical protein
MTNYRDDDVAGFIREVEKETTGNKRVKILQTWFGEVAVKLPPDTGTRPSVSGPHYGPFASKLVDDTSKNWVWVLKSFGSRWMLLEAQYTVKGANADDAEKAVMKSLGVPESSIAIRTLRVVPRTST